MLAGVGEVLPHDEVPLYRPLETVGGEIVSVTLRKVGKDHPQCLIAMALIDWCILI